jgi:hypothetical protein
MPDLKKIEKKTLKSNEQNEISNLENILYLFLSTLFEENNK